MLQAAEVPWTLIDSILLGVAALVILGKFLYRLIKSEFRRRKCVFCEETVPSDEYTHHLEICGLKRIFKRPP